MWQQANARRGSALVVSLMMLLALGFVGAALVVSTSSDLKVAGDDRRGTQAQFVAEAGVQEALHRLAMVSGSQVTINGLTFDPSIRDAASPPNPNWQARIYMPAGSTLSSGDPNVVYAPTVQAASQGLDYAQTGGFMTITHKWVDRNSNGVREAGELVLYDPSQMPPENFTSGSPVEVIDNTGYRGQARRHLQVESTRYPFSPSLLGAVVCDKGVDVRGNVSICGYNHRSTTPIDTGLPACSPAWNATDGHMPAIVTTGDPVDRRGSTDLSGYPAVTDTSSSNPFYTLAQCLGVTQDVVDQMLSHADNTTDGTPPKGITYINGDAHYNGANGTGLLYVKGDLQVSGNFTFKGLIYVEGDFKITGNPWILGGIMVKGKSDYAFSGGNPDILYSSDMIRVALESAFAYVILSWKEI